MDERIGKNIEIKELSILVKVIGKGVHHRLKNINPISPCSLFGLLNRTNQGHETPNIEVCDLFFSFKECTMYDIPSFSLSLSFIKPFLFILALSNILIIFYFLILHLLSLGQPP